MYTCVRDLVDTLKDVARSWGITIPPIPEIPADWEEEAAADYDALKEALFPHVAEPVK